MIMIVGLWIFFLSRYVGWVDFDIIDDDKELVLTFLLVGTMVVLLHLTFEWLFWRETQCCMPCSPEQPDQPMDPRKHALPLGLRWFGLPSMRFTSQESREDLLEWISRAKGMQIHGIYPMEMAMFALEQVNCKQLRAGLRHAKLYDAAS